MIRYFSDRPYAVAVVGAGSGIGRAAAAYLAGQGVMVGCLDRDAPANAASAQAITAAGGTAFAHGVDVTDEATIGPALDAVARAFGRLDGLVNCAGITGLTNRKAHDVDLADFDRVYRINLRGAMALSIAVLPRMLERGYGRVLHVASIAGKEGNAGMAAYSATKAGLIGLVKSMAKDYATTGITINALAPAVIQTPMVDALPAAQVTYMTDKIPMRRCGTLDEVAQIIAWIVSPACSFTTGFTFDLSGGRATY
ncbi:MAG: SDR family NAD(P)-dependent oxidoreductase [Alphaproteobacteria bacterium]